jgi:hypothetical protein
MQENKCAVSNNNHKQHYKNKDRNTSHSGYDHGKVNSVKTMPTTTRRSRHCNDKSAEVPTNMVRVQDNATTTTDVNNQNSKENEREPENFNSISSSGFQMRYGPTVRNSGNQKSPLNHGTNKRVSLFCNPCLRLLYNNS